MQRKLFRAAALVLAFVMLVALPVSKSEKLYADTKSDWQDAKKELKSTINKIKDLESKANKTEQDLEDASEALTKLLNAQKKIEAKIEDVQEEIDQNNLDLEAAQATLDEEYESMKLRIQFMYENNSVDSFWGAVISSSNFSDMLNRVEYVSQVYDSDRKLMDRYENALHEVEEIQIALAEDMEELIELQEDYHEQQEAVEKSIAMLETKKSTYASQISEANDAKQEAQETVDKLAEKMRREEAAAAGANPNTYEGGGTGGGGLGSAAYLSDPSYDPAFKTDISGDGLVDYAMQFVGCHYVWGGNTMGCTDWSDGKGVDCSGFVHLVYAHYGISTPRYSQSFKTVGQPVAFANIKAGDIVVYPGHVAIYIGNGNIVEAQGKNKGVTCTRRVDCHTITAIRRLL